MAESDPGGYRAEPFFTEARRMSIAPLAFDTDSRQWEPVGTGYVARGTIAQLRRRRWKYLLLDEFGLVRCALFGTLTLLGLRELILWFHRMF
jgi:hypothetical protein